MTATMLRIESRLTVLYKGQTYRFQASGILSKVFAKYLIKKKKQKHVVEKRSCKTKWI